MLSNVEYFDKVPLKSCCWDKVSTTSMFPTV